MLKQVTILLTFVLIIVILCGLTLHIVKSVNKPIITKNSVVSPLIGEDPFPVNKTYRELPQREILTQNIEGDKTYGSYSKRDLFYKIISVFEYDSSIPQYCEIFKLEDGRGLTAGIVGFTTAYDDFRLLIDEYSRLNKSNLLKKYSNDLTTIDQNTKKMKSLISDWKSACDDRMFYTAQDNIADKLYYLPALDHAEKLGVKSSVGQLILFDTIIQHGNSNDPDGLPSIIKKANRKVGGSPRDGFNENDWLKAFVLIRKSVLENPNNSDTKDVWSQSTDRCDYFYSLLSSDQTEFELPIYVKTKNHNIIIK